MERDLPHHGLGWIIMEVERVVDVLLELFWFRQAIVSRN